MKNFLRRFFLLGILVVLILSIVPSVYATSYTLYEYFNTGDDASALTWAQNQTGQTFTTNTTLLHTITQVRVKIYRSGAPGDLTAYIYATDSSSNPTGLPLGEGTISGDSLTTTTTGDWYSIILDEAITPAVNTKYALVLSAPFGTSDTVCVGWRYDNASGYGGGGAEEYSLDGGITWSTIAANDMLFEIWGEPALTVLGTKVFSNFLETGDQLFVFPYKVLAGSPYTMDSPQNYFNMQLCTNTTIVAQNKLPAWGYKPGSIYLRASQAIPLGGALTNIKFIGITGSTFAGTSTTYTLVSSDWAGGDKELIDAWVIATASAMEDYYVVTLLEPHSGKFVLNEAGSEIFYTGVPGLATVRPDLFSIVPPGTEMPAKKTHPTTYQDTLIGNFGAKAIAAFDDIGNLLGVEGTFVSLAFWLWVTMMAMMVLGAATGHPIVGLACALPVLFIGVKMGIIEIVYVALPGFLLGVWLIMKWTIWRA